MTQADIFFITLVWAIPEALDDFVQLGQDLLWIIGVRRSTPERLSFPTNQVPSSYSLDLLSGIQIPLLQLFCG